MKNLTTSLSLTVIASLAALGTAVADPITTLFPTGRDAGGAVIALGQQDAHWQVREAADAWTTPIYELNNYCSSCGGIWLEHPQGGTAQDRPLTHPNRVRTGAATNREFGWRTTFTLPANVDLSTVTISYNLGFDDVSRAANGTSNLTGCNHTVWVNDMPVVLTSTGNQYVTGCAATIPAAANFTAGTNTLEFRIFNSSTYYGFRMSQVSGQYALATPVDTDGDGLTDDEEVNDYGTDPNNPDTDGDGLSDGQEVNQTNTDPLDADSDDDGLGDGAEVNDHGTDPNDSDTDGDGLFDGTEVGLTMPNPDTDLGAGNFVPDADPSTTTDPNNADTDGGGVKDGDEDANHDGAVDDGERDPNDAADDDPTDPTHPTTPGDVDGDGFLDGVGVLGGGCNAGGGAGSGLMLVAAALEAIRRRRR